MSERLLTGEELEELAAEMAQGAKKGDRFFLSGPLGAGKSTFARAFLRALGVRGQIPSPTFIMDSVYSIASSGLEVHHMDLYRLSDDTCDFAALGFEEILESGAVVLMEWPEKMPDYGNRSGCRIVIQHCEDQNRRRVRIDWNMAGY